METNKREKLESESIQSVEIAKAFHLYERRNEWVNWNGDTSSVNRSGRFVKLTITEAEQSAEKWRLQGTKFFIDEVPIVYIKTLSGVLVVTEIFTEKPMWAYLNRPFSLSNVKTLGALLKALPDSKWAVHLLLEGHIPASKIDGVYYSRVSSPGKGKNYLAWTLKPRTVDDSAIKKLAADLISLAS